MTLQIIVARNRKTNMEENKIENPNLSNEGEAETEVENENQSNGSEGADETVESLKEKNQSLYEQLKKAKGFTRDEDGKWIKKQESKPQEKSKAKSDELDYGQKAFLYSHDLKVKGEKEINLVKEVMRETGKNLEQVLDSKYFQAELKEMRELSATAEAIPTGKRSGNVATDSVEFWATKDFKDVPKEMKAKVIEFNLKKDNSKNVFYNS